VPENCDVNVELDGTVVAYRSWLAAVEGAAKARKFSFVAAVHRLCGARADPGTVPFHKAPPAAGGQSEAVAAALKGLRAGCEGGASTAKDYASAFDAICPPGSVLGPDMPEHCDAVVQSPVDGRKVRLLLFLHELRQAAEKGDGAAFRPGMAALCGAERLAAGGAKWAEHVPDETSDARSAVVGAMDAMRDACGGADLDEGAYTDAWLQLCPAAGSGAPEALVPEDTSCAGTVTTLEARVATITESGLAVMDAFELAKPFVHDDAARDGIAEAGIALAAATAPAGSF